MHSDAGSARSDHLCDACERQIGHSLEEVSDLRSLAHDLISHYHDFRRTRYELIKDIASLMLRIFTILVFIVPFDKTELTESFKNFLQMIIIIAGKFLHFRKRSRFTLAHHKSSVKALLSDLLAVSPDDILIAAVESPVFRRIL